ncbi:MAG: arylsulfatase A [Kiritimatiellia bacterium]|jgi:arylsulfatase A
MKQMTRLLVLILLTAVPLLSSEAAKPNFVLIFIDDMGYGDIGPFGSTLNRTPHLDQLAKEGTKLTSFYAAPVCSASRAQLMTGCYAPRVSVPGVFFPAGRNGLNPDEMTIADYLKELGYATTCIGKWHLGDQRAFLPTKQGFDHYFGIPYSNDMGRNSAVDGRRVHPLMRDLEVAELVDDEGQRQITRAYTEEAVTFIEAHKREPFFLYFPHTAMHVPLYPHPDFVGKSANGTYGDWVQEVDWSVGQVMETLKRNGLDENTLVVFTSDNGPWASKGSAGGVSGPLRGSKGGTLEGGVREPTIVRWTGNIPAGGENDIMAGTIDILPTFVSLAGGKPRADIIIDGLDITDVLLGKAKESPHEAWYYYSGTRLQAVRSGPWKLALTAQSIGMGMREKPADLQVVPRLYQLDLEIGEITNRASEYPEVVARLQQLAEKMIADIGSGSAGPGVRPAGVVENPVTLYPTASRRGSKPKSVPTKPLDWDKLKMGDTVAAAQAPQISDKPFAIQCTVEGEKLEGMILAHGGSAVGYALYAKDGSIVFAVRTNSDAVHRIRVPAVSGLVSAQLTPDGMMRLIANGETREVKAALINRHPQEDFCIGHDSVHAVDEQAPGKALNGRVSGLKMTY